VEGISAGLTSIWFAAGALAALIAAALGGPVWLQVALFVVVSGVTLWLTRPLVKKYVNSRVKATNADRVLSMIGIVTEDIDNIAATGAVTVDGKVWTARSDSGEKIAAGVQVKPLRIDGVKLIVSPVNQPAEIEK
jgi:membrane protein implicated in regulation of membrane protease activity